MWALPGGCRDGGRADGACGWIQGLDREGFGFFFATCRRFGTAVSKEAALGKIARGCILLCQHRFEGLEVPVSWIGFRDRFGVDVRSRLLGSFGRWIGRWIGLFWLRGVRAAQVACSDRAWIPGDFACSYDMDRIFALRARNGPTDEFRLTHDQFRGTCWTNDAKGIHASSILKGAGRRLAVWIAGSRDVIYCRYFGLPKANAGEENQQNDEIADEFRCEGSSEG